MVTLRKLVERVGAESIQGSLERPIAGIACQAAKIRPGMAFVAVPDSEVEPVESFYTALDRGASVVFCEPNRFSPRKATKIEVGDIRAALADLAAAWHRYPSQKLQVVGIAGDHPINPFLAQMIRRLLEAAGLKTGLISSMRQEIGERILIPAFKPLECLEIQDMLAQMVQAGVAACVVEMDLLGVARQSYRHVDFDHLIHHGDHPHVSPLHSVDYSAWKHEPSAEHLGLNLKPKGRQWFLQFQPNGQAGGNFDIEVRLAGEDLVEAGAVRSRFRRWGTHAHLVTSSYGVWEAELPLVGRSNLALVTAALAVGDVLDLPSPPIISALDRLTPVPGYRQNVNLGRPFLVMADRAGSPLRLREVLRELLELKSRRVILVAGGDGGRDLPWRTMLGRIAAEHSHYTVLTTDNPGWDPPERIAAEIGQGLLEIRQDGIVIELDRRRAIQKAIRLAKPGDVVLIAGRGPDSFQQRGDTVAPFDDVRYALGCLKELGAAKNTGPNPRMHRLAVEV